eukprot:CAMPEP_0173113816 /NCGR_PEP_ID=MMETSP1102-20130122/47158_1 /TAXON_ID=49646 /ORGANISM="Geminigera sp., Strain Caron Lab Isolate" /LENGTH=70 /DNA_ID=CAMNT_0014015789 /DNA_START=68 /DNA_END=280 /DNA_ORIENTATION=+
MTEGEVENLFRGELQSLVLPRFHNTELLHTPKTNPILNRWSAITLESGEARGPQDVTRYNSLNSMIPANW